MSENGQDRAVSQRLLLESISKRYLKTSEKKYGKLFGSLLPVEAFANPRFERESYQLMFASYSSDEEKNGEIGSGWPAGFFSRP